jgi:glycosyltransferase involved in cell wall biosynthesis
MKKNINKKLNISIGIPAYNEEANIQKLLKSILMQTETGFNLSEIIVVSDGSSDKTQVKVLEMNDNRIKLINHNLRHGKSSSLKEIIQIFKGDLLFLLDADIYIKDKNLFEKIVNNTEFNKAGVVSINAMPKKAINSFQKFINAGFNAMKDISLKWNNGQNYLSFKGCFLGMNRNFAKKTNINPELVNNDIYFYLQAKKLGYSPVYLDNAKVYFKSPMNLTDHLKQNERFRNSRDEMQKLFHNDIKSEYKISSKIYLSTIIKNLLINPFYFTGYLMLKAYTEINRRNQSSHIWNIAVSTKQ